MQQKTGTTCIRGFRAMKKEVYMFVLFLLLEISITASQQCSLIGTVLDCSYNRTRYDSPEYANGDIVHSTEEAIVYLPQLTSVINFGCSEETTHFGCAALFPSCTTGLGPCRSLCHRITTDCGTQFVEMLQLEAIVLAPLLRCEKYPTEGCVEPNTIQPSTPVVPIVTTTPVPIPSPSPNSTSSLNSTGCPPPNNNYYTDGAKQFATGWVVTWSVLSFLSTLLTILTFLLDPSRFQYPWRPIIYLALCFNIHSIGYIFAVILGRNVVTCPGEQYVTNSISWGWEHVPCIFVFGLLYYTMMAAFLWWLVLTLSWFLATALKWSNEAIGNTAPFFHVISWILPLLMAIGLLAGKLVSADELTGVCFVIRDDGMSSQYALLFGVIMPLIIFLLIGLFFLVLGLVSVCRIHAFLRHEGQERESVVLERLIIRVGIFVCIYILPAAVVIGCFSYELIQRPTWKTLNETCIESCAKANPTVILVRVFMFMIIGVLTGVWIWSKKTLKSWKDAITNVRSCCVSKSVESSIPDPVGSSMVNMKY